MKKLLFFAAAVAFSAAVFSCKKAEIVTPEPPVISVSGLSDDLTINVKAEGEACSFGYEIANPATGVELNVKADKSWITDIEAKDGKITFNVTESKENSERTAIVTLSYTGADDVNVTVKQAAYFAPVISVSGISGNPPVISAGAEGGESSFGYSIENPADGVELAASTDADWISGISTADGKVTFTIQENTTFMKRAATITLTYTGAADVTVNVEQDAALKPVIKVAQEGPVAAEAAGGEYSFSYEVTNPVDGAELTASADADWISAISTADAKVTFTVAANETTEARSASITLSYTGAENVTVTVEQAAGEAAPVPEVGVTDFTVTGNQVSFTTAPNKATYNYTYVIVRDNDKVMSSKTDQEIYEGWIEGNNAFLKKQTLYGYQGNYPVSQSIGGMNPSGNYFLAIAAFSSDGNLGKIFRKEFTIE